MTVPTLTRQPGVPLWRQVAARLAEEIAGQGERRLPSEQELARRFGVNRHTVRQAIRSLADLGLVRAEQGRGTFVADLVVDYPIGARTRFTATLRAQDLEPSREILGHETIAAEKDVATALAIAPGAGVARIRSLALADGVPIGMTAYHVAASRFPDAAVAFARSPSMTAVLEAFGVGDYRRLSTRIHARLPEPHEALLLRLAAGLPVLVTEGVDVEPDGRPLAFAASIWAADRVQFLVDS